MSEASRRRKQGHAAAAATVPVAHALPLLLALLPLLLPKATLQRTSTLSGACGTACRFFRGRYSSTGLLS
jgi:hypothetical protein